MGIIWRMDGAFMCVVKTIWALLYIFLTLLYKNGTM